MMYKHQIMFVEIPTYILHVHVYVYIYTYVCYTHSVCVWLVLVPNSDSKSICSFMEVPSSIVIPILLRIPSSSLEIDVAGVPQRSSHFTVCCWIKLGSFNLKYLYNICNIYNIFYNKGCVLLLAAYYMYKYCTCSLWLLEPNCYNI